MDKKVKRILLTIIGTAVTGFSVGILRKAALGTDPFTAFTTGCATALHSTYGTLYPFVIGVLLIFVFFLDKHYIGFGTILNLFIIGPIADFSLNLLNSVFEADTLLIRSMTLAVAIFVLCFGASLYISADLGVSSYDAISLIMADKKVAQYRFCRIFTDVICVILAFVLGAKTSIGIGTIITACGMGPIVQFFVRNIGEKIIYGKNGNPDNCI
ncbi:MAG: hypothetical protein IJN92_03190 [Lachnospiraceae bacterium]|nr:hypothetical protein [Lachnospiraceae bacterium]